MDRKFFDNMLIDNLLTIAYTNIRNETELNFLQGGYTS